MNGIMHSHHKTRPLRILSRIRQISVARDSARTDHDATPGSIGSGLDASRQDAETLSASLAERERHLEAVHYDLRIHQEELRAQNDELQNANINIEKFYIRYRDLYEYAPVGFFILDERYSIVDLNENALRMLGVGQKNITRKLFSKFISSESHQLLFEHFKKIQSSRRASSELWLVSELGAAFPAIVESVQLGDVWGDGWRCLTTVVDITERKALETDLKKTNEDLEQFSYAASHDLRQPLRMVTNYLSLIEKRIGHQLDGDIKTYFEFARNGAIRMDQLITDLLKYSHAGRFEHANPVQLGQAVADSLFHLGALIHDVGANIEVAENLPTVNGSLTDLVSLFQNLIENAIKYRMPDRPPCVEVGWSSHENGCHVWVKDNGMGIAPEHHERAFKIFQRLVPRESHEGTGIGLALCKKIMARHGGNIWIESVPGEGCVFFMGFPVVTVTN